MESEGKRKKEKTGGGVDWGERNQRRSFGASKEMGEYCSVG